MNSMFEVLAGELRAKLMGEQPVRQRAGPGGGARGRRGLVGLVQATQAPPVWRAPEGPEGLGGPRDRPLRAKLACGDLAGGRARRRPEHQRCHWQRAGGPPPTSTPSSPAPQLGRPSPRTPAVPLATPRAGRRPRAHQAARHHTQQSRPAPQGPGGSTQYQRIIEESRQYQDYRDRFPGAHSRCRASRRCPWRCLPSGDPRRRR